MSRSVGGSASGRAITWAWNLPHQPPPAEVRRAAAHHVLDALGCAVAGARSGAAAPVLTVAHRTAGWGPATLLDGNGPVTVEDAALGNGALIRCLDLDDSHAPSRVHVGAAVLPAALAVAEQVEATGMDLIGSYLAGAELACRLGSAVPGGFHSRGLHATSVVGVFASALAVAWLREVDPHVAQNALGICGSLAAGPFQQAGPGSIDGHLQAGLAGRNAMLAVDLAAAGAGGPADVWEGPAGLFATSLGIDVPADDLVEGLGTRWDSTRISIRRSPCSRLAEGAVEAARSLAADGVTADDVVDLVAVVHPGTTGIVCRPFPAGQAGSHPGPDAMADPDSPDEARFSLPWCIAATLVDGDLGLGSFDQDRVRRPDVLALAARVRCEMADRTHGPPEGQPGHLRVRLSDGEEVVAMAPGDLGGPDHTPDDDALVRRFVASCGGHPAAAAVAGRILALEDEPSVQDLMARVAGLAAGDGPPGPDHDD